MKKILCFWWLIITGVQNFYVVTFKKEQRNGNPLRHHCLHILHG